MVDLARKNLLHDRLRFAITVSGVAFAVTLVLVQVGLFLGLLQNASITIDRLPADLWITSRNTPNVDFSHTFSETAVQRVRSVPGVQRADNLLIWFMTIALPNGAQEGAEVYAMENFADWQFPWNVSAGDVQNLRRGPYMFLDESARQRYGNFHLGDYREVMGRRLKIVGTTREAKSFTTTPLAMMDFHLAQQLGASVLDRKTTYIVVRVQPGADIEAVRAAIRRRLPYNDVYTRAEWANRSRGYWVANTGIGLNMYVTVFLGCLVGVVVVAQTLYTATMEHLKEFGTVKAIGGGNAHIYGILARQSVIAAVVGFACGALTAYAMRPVIAAINLKLILPTPVTAVVFVGTVVLCLAAGMVSYRKVAGLDPALVFRG